MDAAQSVSDVDSHSFSQRPLKGNSFMFNDSCFIDVDEELEKHNAVMVVDVTDSNCTAMPDCNYVKINSLPDCNYGRSSSSHNKKSGINIAMSNYSKRVAPTTVNLSLGHDQNAPIFISDVSNSLSAIISTNDNIPIVIDDSSDEDIQSVKSDDDIVVIDSGKVEFLSQIRKILPVAAANADNSSSDGLKSQVVSPNAKSLDKITLVVSSDIFDLMTEPTDHQENEMTEVTDMFAINQADFDLSSGYNSGVSSEDAPDSEDETKTEEDMGFFGYDSLMVDNGDVNGAKMERNWTFHRFSSIESDVPANTCKICFVRLPPKQLRRHSKWHEEERTVQCSSCFLMFESGLMLEEHEKVHYSEHEPDKSEFSMDILDCAKLKCLFCDSDFDSEMNLNLHQHDSFCEYCQLKINCQGFLQSHVSTKCEEYKKLYPCKFCKKGFKRINSLIHHLSLTVCKYCKRLDQLKTKSDGLELKDLFVQCTNCKLYLPTKDALDKHKEAVECDDRNCGKVFRCQTRFFIHKMEDYDFEVNCQRCSTEFDSFRDLIKHRKECYSVNQGQRRTSSVKMPTGTKCSVGNKKALTFVGRSSKEGFVTVRKLKKLYAKSRGSVVKFARKLGKLYPRTYGTHTNVAHLSRCIENALDKADNLDDFFLPKRRKKKIKRYY